MVLTLDTQQEAIHALFQLASLAKDLLRVTLSSLCQLIGSNQQLLCVCDRILTQTTMRNANDSQCHNGTGFTQY